MSELSGYCCVLIIALALGGLDTKITAQAKRVRVVELTDGWKLRNENSTIQVAIANIPSGVYTALAGTYGDLLEGRNDVDLRWIARENWIYTTTFDDDEVGADRTVNLTLHGIDTISKVWLNDELLGHTDNMFVRYSYDVGHLLRTNNNVLTIELLSPLKEAAQLADMLEKKGEPAPQNCLKSSDKFECDQNMLRKMQMSFGGTWNPAAPSLGIWKPVTLEYYEVAILRDVDVAIRRTESYWIMDCRAFISTGSPEYFYAELEVYSSPLLDNDSPFVVQQQKMSYASPIMEFKVKIPVENVKLWWPNGYGDQVLYPVMFILKTYRDAEGPGLMSRTQSQKLLRIGFRTIELVEDEDSNGHSFYFRVNGQSIFMKGINYVPAHTLPELSADTDAVTHLLESAKGAHMNMIRVWGGGLYESDYFYELADSLGLLIWQDMAFTSATYPVYTEFVEPIRIETSQNARRLAYHPSLAMIVTNNEVELFLVKNRSAFGADAQRLEKEYKQLFMGTVKPELDIISRNDYSPRPGPMLSTPSNGVELSSKDLPIDPQDPSCGDVHFWSDNSNGFGPDIYPHARFISEYGYTSLPVRHSWERTFGNSFNGTLSDLIQHRQHHPDGFQPLLRLIQDQLPFSAETWDNNIDQLIYFSQVAQAIAVKTAMDLFRSLRGEKQTMGALIWQLNDVWVAPTWSFIDFYGNYKLVYYWAKEFLKPTTVIGLYDQPSDLLNITISLEEYNENPETSQLYTVWVYTYLWSDLFPKKKIARGNLMKSNDILPLSIALESTLFEEHNKSETFLMIELVDEYDIIVARTYFYPVPIKNIEGIRDPLLIMDLYTSECDASTYTNSFSVRIKVSYPALFVYLEVTNPDIAKHTHKFSKNGFTLTEPVTVVHLEFIGLSECLDLQKKHIAITTMNQYLI
ncbi:beta-mannosidase-like [Scaptodrosophila lebanonensis]|uniref:beta-mannosidase n=1 Tax=Drosophila lebanonensis TaxID=7225 RepID=A0A6J2T5V2_DROLE|nr:beta-mannosidase-like [Scaptodrosophila lebanonensis]